MNFSGDQQRPHKLPQCRPEDKNLRCQNRKSPCRGSARGNSSLNEGFGNLLGLIGCLHGPRGLARREPDRQHPECQQADREHQVLAARSERREQDPDELSKRMRRGRDRNRVVHNYAR